MTVLEIDIPSGVPVIGDTGIFCRALALLMKHHESKSHGVWRDETVVCNG